MTSGIRPVVNIKYKKYSDKTTLRSESDAEESHASLQQFGSRSLHVEMNCEPRYSLQQHIYSVGYSCSLRGHVSDLHFSPFCVWMQPLIRLWANAATENHYLFKWQHNNLWVCTRYNDNTLEQFLTNKHTSLDFSQRWSRVSVHFGI